MPRVLNHWRRVHRYRSTARALRSLSPKQLHAHGILPSEIDRLACEVARVPWK